MVYGIAEMRVGMGETLGVRGSLPIVLMRDGFVSPRWGLDSLGVRVQFDALDLGSRRVSHFKKCVALESWRLRIVVLDLKGVDADKDLGRVFMI